MKIQNNLPKFNEDLHLELTENGWVPLREPGSLAVSFFLSIPFMIINVFISIGVINIFSTISFEEFGFTPDSFTITINLGVILIIILIIVLHELLHLLFIPNFIRSDKTYLGLIWLGGFVVTEEEITKSRYIIITIAPFVIISIIAPLILGAFGLLTAPVKLFVLLNALASSVDMLNLLITIKQVPGNTVLKQNGSKTYWKEK
jgi:hypothetical protein